ncbi:MAG: hypothetical protein EBR82_67660 [Caulobacteraceae bacterium]|nr:hypothetical protein [Caulobacteraceae bacterium]NDC56725.1 hypothetical protein [Alphaproteobacteria bacterium]
MLCVTMVPMKEKKETEPVRISKKLTKMLRSLAVHHDLSMPEYLEALLESPVAEAYARMVESQQQSLDELIRKPKK